VALHPLALGQFIPSPPVSGFHIGPLFVHFYGLMYIVGIALAIYIARRRLAASGGDPGLVYDVAFWGVPAGLIGARIYFDITTPFDIVPKPCFAGLLGDVCPPGHQWWGPLAIWDGGQAVWGGIAVGALVGAWRVRRAGGNVGVFADAAAPALLVAQAIARIGNYFDQQLFGKPSTLPWAVQVGGAARLHAGIPAADLRFSTFQPSFLYELIFDLALAAGLVWLGHHRRIRPPGLFALYVAGYSGYRIFEETIRIDSSARFLGLRLNFFVAVVMTLAGLAWFAISQRRSRVVTNGAAVLAIAGALGACAAGCGRAGQLAQAGVSQRHATAVLAPGRMAPKSCAGHAQAVSAGAGATR
jgi:phosphatidylglycerol---prolipoprotein diacylglyceryl transferase